MGVLEQVTQMKNQGVPEDQIISKLQEQGVSPKSINDALNQSQIKNAVSPTQTNQQQDYGDYSYSGNPGDPPEQKAMGGQNYDYGGYDQAGAQEMNASQYPPQNNYPVDNQNYGGYEQYPQTDEYSTYPNYGGGAYGGTDNYVEVAEQVFSEKIREVKKQIEELSEFKTLAQVKLDNSLERLKRIENSMDKLQMAILDKVGSYGGTLESIKKEMNMMQDSFSKSLPNMNKAHKTSSKKTGKKTTHKK